MLRHTKCGEMVVINLNELISLDGIGIIGSDLNIVIGKIYFKTNKKKSTKVNFVCQHCKTENLSLEEIYDSCNNCSRNNILSSLFIPLESGGLFCDKCIVKFFKEEKTINVTEINGVTIP